MSLTLIVPCHNHWKTTASCLASIFKSELPEKYRIIVIDDVSTDFTPKLVDTVIKQGYPVTLLTNTENIGYLGSTNKALKIVDTNFILFMNNDVYLDKDCIKNLLEVYQKHPEVGILGATQLNSNREESLPLKYFLKGEKATTRDHIITTNIPENLKNADLVYCDDVHFACALLSKAIVDKVGLLDEDFGKGNYEQEAYCLSVKEKGKQIAVCPKAKFIHYGSVSVMDSIAYYSQLLDKNREIFFKKWGEKLRKNLV